MRKYAKVSPSFWTGTTGRELKRRGFEAVVVSLYLMSSPHSNMLGLFYQPVLYMAHETGLGIEGASKGLQACIEAGFCRYDDRTEMVWVIEMAAYQIGDQLSKADKQCKGIARDYEALPNCPFLQGFFDRYADAFHLPRAHSGSGEKPAGEPSPFEAPSKPGTGTGTGTGDRNPPKPPRKRGGGELSKTLGCNELVADGVAEKHATDWLAVRKAKRAPLTATAWDAVKREAILAAMTPGQAVQVAAERGWQGFKASWLAQDPVKHANGSDPFHGAL